MRSREDATGEGVRKEGTGKKRWGMGAFAAGPLHATLGLPPAGQGSGTLVSIYLMKILRPREAQISPST